MLTQGFTATLVATTLEISRSSLYYRKRPRGSRADRTYDEQIVMACGEKLAYGYRRVAWWLRRKEKLPVNRKRVLRVMRERGLLVRSRRLRARRKKAWGRVEAASPNQIWQSDMTKIWAGPAVGWAYLVYHDRPHRGVQNRTPHEAFLAFAGVTRASSTGLCNTIQCVDLTPLPREK